MRAGRSVASARLVVDTIKLRVFWLTEFSTKGIVDGQKLNVTAPLVVIRTRQYPVPLGGTNTIFVARPIKLPQTKPTPPKVEAKQADGFRTWTSANGESTIEAKFSKFAMGTVYLEKRGGDVVEVPIGKLSKPDQDFIRNKSR